MELEIGEQPYGDGSSIPSPAFPFSHGPTAPIWTKGRAPIVALLLVLTAISACAGIAATLGHYCRPHQGRHHGVHHATHSSKGGRRRQARTAGGGGATTGDSGATTSGDEPGCPLDVEHCVRRTGDGFCPLRQVLCPWVDYGRVLLAKQSAMECKLDAIGAGVETLVARTATAREDTRPTATGTSAHGDGGSATGNHFTVDANQIIHKIGRLEYRADFREVWVDNVHFDLRHHGKARLFVECMVVNRAFDVSSAKHLAAEIAPYVWAKGNYPPSAEIRVQDFFKDRDGELARLRQMLVIAAGDKGKYYLNIGKV
jgi:hypothetical protein